MNKPVSTSLHLSYIIRLSPHPHPDLSLHQSLHLSISLHHSFHLYNTLSLHPFISFSPSSPLSPHPSPYNCILPSPLLFLSLRTSLYHSIYVSASPSWSIIPLSSLHPSLYHSIHLPVSTSWSMSPSPTLHSSLYHSITPSTHLPIHLLFFSSTPYHVIHLCISASFHLFHLHSTFFTPSIFLSSYLHHSIHLSIIQCTSPFLYPSL